MTDGNLPGAQPVFTERAGLAWTEAQDKTDAQLDPIGRVAIAALPLSLGQRVIDVGCGCGQTLLQLGDIVGRAGHVLGVDISAPMLARARQRAEGRPQIATAIADAETYSFDAGAFDAVYSRFGVMFFQDPRAAFANLRRAMRKGGCLSFACWQALARNPWAEQPLRAVAAVLPPAPLQPMLQPDNPGPFYLADPERVRTILSGTGFTNIVVDGWENPVHLGGAMTVAQAVAYCRLIGPASRAMADAPEALSPALDAALTAALEPFSSARGIWMDAAAFIVTARA
ncbi:MAG TPA: class I SAM-dependent methyltransferase [Polyangia bacterium]|jgi:SAM-dependent methyltransferase